MEAVVEALEKQMDNTTDRSDFRDIGKKWACYSLDTYNGDLLERALKISVALCDFESELRGS